MKNSLKVPYLSHYAKGECRGNQQEPSVFDFKFGLPTWSVGRSRSLTQGMECLIWLWKYHLDMPSDPISRRIPHKSLLLLLIARHHWKSTISYTPTPTLLLLVVVVCGDRVDICRVEQIQSTVMWAWYGSNQQPPIIIFGSPSLHKTDNKPKCAATAVSWVSRKCKATLLRRRDNDVFRIKPNKLCGWEFNWNYPTSVGTASKLIMTTTTSTTTTPPYPIHHSSRPCQSSRRWWSQGTKGTRGKDKLGRYTLL